jgi:hypothetical protein
MAVLVARGVERSPRAAPAAGLALLCLGTLTVSGARVWESDRALWAHTAERIDGHWRAEAWLGYTALDEGDVETAVGHLTRAVDAAPRDAKTQFRLAEALQKLAASVTGDEVFALTTGARDRYATAAALFATGRQENAGLLAPLAMVRATDLTLALGDIPRATALVEGLVAQPRPAIPPIAVEAWNTDVDQLAAHVEQFIDPGRAEPLAPGVRAWRVGP